MPRLLILPLCLVLGLSTGVWAQEPPDAEAPDDDDTAFTGDIATGRDMAEQLCSRCHSVTTEGESPVADAPPFRILSHLWPLSHLEEALAEGIMVGHPVYQMPVFQFTPDEIADLLTYIHSIQDKTPPKPEE